MKKILITGSAGVIGKSLLENPESSFEAVELDIHCPKSLEAYGDVRDYRLLVKRMQGCEGVIHLAAVSRVGEGEAKPDLCWDTNFNGTFNVLKAALNLKKRPWVIFASSREVYGQQDVLPVKETALPQPLNTYAKSKAKAEESCIQAKEQGLNVAIVRFANVFGRADDYANRVIPAFCQAALQGEPLHLQGAANIFDFIHINDIVRGIHKTIEYLRRQGAPSLPLHLTTGVGIEIRALAEMICKLAHSASPLIEAPARSCDIHSFCGDATLTQRILGWQPQVTLQEGLQKLLQNCKYRWKPF